MLLLLLLLLPLDRFIILIRAFAVDEYDDEDDVAVAVAMEDVIGGETVAVALLLLPPLESFPKLVLEGLFPFVEEDGVVGALLLPEQLLVPPP